MISIGNAMRSVSRSKKLSAGLVLTGLVVLASIIGPLLVPYDPIRIDLPSAFQPPSLMHPLGTDNLGRDLLTRTLVAGRIDLGIAAVVTIVPFVTGSLIGLVAGYRGGWLDVVLMRLVDVIIAFPFIVLIIAIVAILGSGIPSLLVAFFLISWTSYARIVRSRTLTVRQLAYVTAARGLGYSPLRVVLSHVLPSAVAPALVFAVSDAILAILTVGSMSFLGLGVRPPTPEWGALVASGRIYLSQAWWISTLPGIPILLLAVGLSLAGDALGERIEHAR